MNKIIMKLISEMPSDKETQKRFRIKILKGQLISIGEQFHAKAKMWLQEIKEKVGIEVSAETKTKPHPNQLMLN